MIGDSGTTYTSDAVIIATGAQAKWLGLPSEEKFQGFGVSACATCDGFFYRGKEVVVVGGGNTAVEEALFLTNFASRVTLVHRRDSLRAEKILQHRLLNHEKVEVLWDTTLEEILGDQDPLGVTGVRLKNVKSGEVYDRDTHGVFIAIGHKPATDVFKGHVEMNEGGYITTAPDSTATDIPGVYATGDVRFFDSRGRTFENFPIRCVAANHSLRRQPRHPPLSPSCARPDADGTRTYSI